MIDDEPMRKSSRKFFVERHLDENQFNVQLDSEHRSLYRTFRFSHNIRWFQRDENDDNFN